MPPKERADRAWQAKGSHGIKYTVARKNNRYSCTCVAGTGRFKKGGNAAGKHCKHIKARLALVGKQEQKEAPGSSSSACTVPWLDGVALDGLAHKKLVALAKRTGGVVAANQSSSLLSSALKAFSQSPSQPKAAGAAGGGGDGVTEGVGGAARGGGSGSTKKESVTAAAEEEAKLLRRVEAADYRKWKRKWKIN